MCLLVSPPEIIDDLSHLVDKTDGKIRNESRRVKLVETKASSCGEFLPHTSRQFPGLHHINSSVLSESEMHIGKMAGSLHGGVLVKFLELYK